jgi:hypothetical protein
MPFTMRRLHAATSLVCLLAGCGAPGSASPATIWQPGTYSLAGSAVTRLELSGDGSFTIVFDESQEAARRVGGRWLPGWDDDDFAELTVSYSSWPGIEPGHALQVELDGTSFRLHRAPATALPCGTMR